MKIRESLAVLLVICFLSVSPQAAAQSPLGVGRKYSSIERMQPARLRAVRDDRLRLQRERRTVTMKTGYQDYRAILHAHAEDAAHTGGTRPEMLAAARRANVQIIMLTDHVRPERDFIRDSWRGLRDGVLFIPGAEHEGFLAYPQTSIQSFIREKAWKTRDDYIGIIKAEGGNIFLSHVEERLDWDTSRLDGLEIYNHHTDIKDEGAYLMWLTTGLTNAARLRQLVEALATYPEEVFGAQQDYLAPILAKWDKDTEHHRLTGVAANDCHHNQVFTVTCVDADTIEIGYITSKPTTRRVTTAQVAEVAELTRHRQPGELLARLDFDIYERSMTYVNTHILANRLDEASVRQALRDGRAYVAHDWLGDATGFAFLATREGKRLGVMGDEVKLVKGLQLEAEAPLACQWRLIRNGAVAQTTEGRRWRFAPQTPGVYRVEAWLTIDGEPRPWIYANPIYVKPAEN